MTHLPASIVGPAARISLNHILDNGALEKAGLCRIDRGRVKHRHFIPLNFDDMRSGDRDVRDSRERLS